jgi:hypothetical protein
MTTEILRDGIFASSSNKSRKPTTLWKVSLNTTTCRTGFATWEVMCSTCSARQQISCRSCARSASAKRANP